jgi:hypothetical protein
MLAILTSCQRNVINSNTETKADMNMKRIGLLSFATILGLGLAGCMDHYEPNGKHYSEGDRTGVVNKFSFKGLDNCKRWEGELVMGGLRTNSQTTSDGDTIDTLAANIWVFTVPKDRKDLISTIKEANADGLRVTISYDQVQSPDPCESSSGYFVTAVKTRK